MPRRSKTSASKDEPWDRDNPRAAAGKPAKHLTPAQKSSAKRHAKAAGRPYPNLVDNMRAASASAGKGKKT